MQDSRGRFAELSRTWMKLLPLYSPIKTNNKPLIVMTETEKRRGSIVSIQPAFEEKLARRATVMSKNRARQPDA